MIRRMYMIFPFGMYYPVNPENPVNPVKKKQQMYSFLLVTLFVINPAKIVLSID